MTRITRRKVYLIVGLLMLITVFVAGCGPFTGQHSYVAYPMIVHDESLHMKYSLDLYKSGTFGHALFPGGGFLNLLFSLIHLLHNLLL